MQIMRRLVLTMTGLGLAAGSVLAVGLATPASATTTTTTAQPLTISQTCHKTQCRHARHNVNPNINLPNITHTSSTCLSAYSALQIQACDLSSETQ